MIATERTKAVRACAVLGGGLWGLAAIWAFAIISAGFVNWQYTSVYVFLLLVILGLSTNVVLFWRAAALATTTRIAVMAVSLSLSAVVVGSIIFMASG